MLERCCIVTNEWFVKGKSRGNSTDTISSNNQNFKFIESFSNGKSAKHQRKPKFTWKFRNSIESIKKSRTEKNFDHHRSKVQKQLTDYSQLASQTNPQNAQNKIKTQNSSVHNLRNLLNRVKSKKWNKNPKIKSINQFSLILSVS